MTLQETIERMKAAGATEKEIADYHRDEERKRREAIDAAIERANAARQDHAERIWIWLFWALGGVLFLFLVLKGLGFV